MNSKAIVIGAGVAGLASSIRLANKGFQVDVYEQSDRPGGKLNEISWNDYRWDTGPSLFTLPELMEELFQISGEEMKTAIRYEKLELITKYFYGDGTRLNAYGDSEKFIKEAASVTGEPASKIHAYLQRCKTMYDLTKDVFIFSTFSRLSTFYSKKFLKALMQVWKLDSLTTMHRANARQFKSPYLVQLFDRYATYNGSNPYRAPGTLNMIAHLEHNLGAYFPHQGMYSLARGLHELALRKGVTFHFNTAVEEVILNNNKAEGIRIKDKHVKADVIVSDVDIYYFYRDLLKSVPFPEKHFKNESSSSALVFYWAIEKTFPELDLHNILFSEDYKTEFEHLFTKKDLFDDPTVYIFISSKMVEDDAPKNGENWFVMINAPENTGQDWDALVARARDVIQQKIKNVLNTDISPYIRKEFITDPRTIETNTFSYHGSLYGNSSNSKFSAFSRHPNHLRKFKGLYFVGGSVHPGGGIPLCLASSKIVDSYIY